jgi:hypothetical protein
MGTWGIAAVSAYILLTIADGLGTAWHLGWMHYAHWILTENPYYPIQILLGFYFGWTLYRRYRHRSMLWVWVLPLMLLCFGVTTFTPEWKSVLEGPRTSTVSHYFGWEGTVQRGSCPSATCMDQLLTTMPFYAAAAYSMGAWFGRKHQQQISRVQA